VSGENSPLEELRRLANGFRVSQAIHVAARLGIADLLADGPREVSELAAATEADERSLYRLLRALAAAGVFREEENRRFSLTPLSDHLRRDAPETLYGWAAFAGLPLVWQAWGDLEHSVRTGENAVRHLHGMDIWEYRARDPVERAAFDLAMTDVTRGVNRSLLSVYDFGRFATVVDVGGGRGALLTALLEAHPGMRGVLFDRPEVVDGVADELDPGIADRLRVIGGDFFDEVPGGGDAYLMKAIIHDWEDAEALRILESCRRAAAPGAALLVVDRELGTPNGDLDAKLGDLNMLVLPGGRERTTDEFAALFASAGFRFVGETPSPSGWHVFEGVAE